MAKTGIRSYQTKTKGTCWLAYCHMNGRQVLKRGFRTARQAERWGSEVIGRVKYPSESTITLGEWALEWLQRHRSQVKSSTHARYRVSFDSWSIPHTAKLSFKLH